MAKAKDGRRARLLAARRGEKRTSRDRHSKRRERDNLTRQVRGRTYRIAAVERPERAYRSAFRGIAPRRAGFDYHLAERERRGPS